jgi:hypothetical protein
MPKGLAVNRAGGVLLRNIEYLVKRALGLARLLKLAPEITGRFFGRSDRH